MSIKVNIKKVIKTGSKTYDAILEINYENSIIKLIVPGLVREPHKIKVSEVREEVIKIDFINEKDEGYASCYIPTEALKKGYLELKCPKGSGWVIKEEHKDQ